MSSYNFQTFLKENLNFNKSKMTMIYLETKRCKILKLNNKNILKLLKKNLLITIKINFNLILNKYRIVTILKKFKSALNNY